MITEDTPTRDGAELARLRVENSLLHQQVARLGILQEVALALADEQEPVRLLDRIACAAMALVDGTAASLLLLDGTSQELVFEVVQGELAHGLRGRRLRKGQGIAGWVAARGIPAAVSDVEGDPRHAQEFYRLGGFRPDNLLAVPLQVGERVLGVLEVLNKAEGDFAHQDIPWLMALAGQAAIAVENGRIHRSLADERSRVLNLQEEMRRRLARDLHDGAAQSLAALAMNIDFLRKVLEHQPERLAAEMDMLKALALKTSSELRTLLFELRPAILDSQGLVPALQSYVERLQNPLGPSIQLRCRGDLSTIDQATASAVFIIAQEALSNVRKHSQARTCRVTLLRREGLLLVVIVDNGIGFDVAGVLRDYDQRDHFGLLNMRDRAELLGGSLAVSSVMNRGTTVTLRVPA